MDVENRLTIIKRVSPEILLSRILEYRKSNEEVKQLEIAQPIGERIELYPLENFTWLTADRILSACSKWEYKIADISQKGNTIAIKHVINHELSTVEIYYKNLLNLRLRVYKAVINILEGKEFSLTYPIAEAAHAGWWLTVDSNYLTMGDAFRVKISD